MARLLVIVVGAALLVSVSSPAWAEDDDVVFDGAGWGHGVGLSQWGAYGMSVQGATHTEILTHYYQGTALSAGAPLPPLWVNLERNFSELTLAVRDVGAATGAPVVVTSAAGQISAAPGTQLQLTVPAGGGCAVTLLDAGVPSGEIADPNCAIDFTWYDWMDPVATPTTKVEIAGCTLVDWNAIPSVSRPCAYARGMLHLRSGSGGLDLSVELLMEDYVLGISEMPYGWGTSGGAEALRAQAVAARSYARELQLTRGEPGANSCDGWCHVRDTTFDQRYVGWGHANSGPWIDAVRATAHRVLTHPKADRGVARTYYFSSSGGRTENGHERFSFSEPVPYLVSVDDSPAIDGTVANPRASWRIRVPAMQVADALGFDLLKSVKVVETRSGSGSAAVLEYTGFVNGALVVETRSGTWTRITFGLYSEYLAVSYSAPIPAPGADEMLFYKADGTFGYYPILESGRLGAPLLTGDGYTEGWSSIVPVDLDGDGLDEMLFYRDDGLFRYYNVNSDGTIGSPMAAGEGYTKGWSAITAVDLDGDGQDEMFFYRDDGLFRYYNIRPDGTIRSPMAAGDGYTKGWSTITAVDLDGDGQDEMYFYRDDGLVRVYHVRFDGTLPAALVTDDDFTSGWSVVTSVNLYP